MQPNNAAQDKSPKPQDKAPELELHVGMKSDVGPKRKLNEDYAGYRLPDEEAQRSTKGALFVVADGMGGHQAGEVASKEAVVRVIEEYYADTAHPPGESLVRAVRVANRVIHDHALSDPSKSGMGTTLVAAAVVGQKVFVANVGDSRAYLIDGQGISQITEDHSWVAEQIQAGLMGREEAVRHPQRNVITRALGSKASVEIDLFEGHLGEGETLLLCTDGVCGPLRGRQMARVVRSVDPPKAAVQIVSQAGSVGGDDNATVLIVHAARPRQERPEDRQRTVVSQVPVLALSALAGARERLDSLAAVALHKLGLGQAARPLLLGLVALLLLLCLAAAVALIWGGGPLPAAAPQPADVYDVRVSAQPFWPSPWGLYLAGEARDWQCEQQPCSFTLEVAGVEYQVSYTPTEEHPARVGRRVLVFGWGQEGSKAIDAQLIVRRNRLWPRQKIVHQAQAQVEGPIWVYGIVDKRPNGLVEPGDDGGQQRGEPVLLYGQWQEGESWPPFEPGQIYRLEGDRYIPSSGNPDLVSPPAPLPEATTTLAPKPTPTDRPKKPPRIWPLNVGPGSGGP